MRVQHQHSLTYPRKKSGNICLCLDPKDLNKAIMRPHYAYKTEVSYSLCVAKFFSKLDARSVYWVMELDDAASMLTTFNIH